MRIFRLVMMAAIAVLGSCNVTPDASGDPFALPAGTDATEWPLYGHGFGEQRFSPVADITRANVGTLGLAFSFDDFIVRGRTHRGAQATPIMVDGTLYFTGPWSVVYAVDAKTGALKWSHDPEVDGGWGRHACCDVVNRGVAVWKGVVYVGTVDGWLVALDAATGKQKWRSDTFVDRTKSYAITGAPRIAGNNIVIGNGGAEMGVRGYVSAYDAETGKLSWRFYTVPGAGPDEHPEVAMARKTWASTARWDLGGGGTAWDGMTYDPALGLIYIGVGNAGPYPAKLRNGGGAGDNLFVSSIVALDAATGRMKWYYQTTPGDEWDFTATQNMILADLDIGGKPRKVLMQAPKNGFFYVLDRETGALLSAEKYTPVTWASHVDMKTGRPVLLDNADYSKQERVIWPSQAGGHNWAPMAFSRETGLVYIPTIEMPIKFMVADKEMKKLVPGAANIGVGADFADAKRDAAIMKGMPAPTQHTVLKAWDPKTGKVVWQSKPMPYWGGGVLTTAGGLVFHGSTDGKLRVYGATDGALLKEIDTGLAIMAAPMTYRIDGQQYVAVLAGLGGAMTGFPLLPGFAANIYQNHERLLVFKLGGGPVDLPPRYVKPAVQPIPTGLPTDAATIQRGLMAYAVNCARCHAPSGTRNGYPDLWNLSPETHAAFDSIVLDGALSYAGMASFKDVLTPADTLAIRAFIADDRRKAGTRKPVERSAGH